jgi:anti-sigma regulatory factor (Ser/Thr protein kinase)
VLLQIPAEPRSVRTARSAVLRDPVMADLSPDVQRDVVLVVSELVSNAVAAAPDGTEVQIAIEQRGRGGIVVEVRNRVAAEPILPIDPAMPPPNAVDGRGLALVHQMSGDLQARYERGQLVVSAVLESIAAGPVIA